MTDDRGPRVVVERKEAGRETLHLDQASPIRCPHNHLALAGSTETRRNSHPRPDRTSLNSRYSPPAGINWQVAIWQEYSISHVIFSRESWGTFLGVEERVGGGDWEMWEE